MPLKLQSHRQLEKKIAWRGFREAIFHILNPIFAHYLTRELVAFFPHATRLISNYFLLSFELLMVPRLAWLRYRSKVGMHHLLFPALATGVSACMTIQHVWRPSLDHGSNNHVSSGLAGFIVSKASGSSIGSVLNKI